MKKWLCVICGLIYDEAEGWPDDGIAPGTRWEDVPDDWTCPDCGVGKEDFEMLEVTDDEPVSAGETAEKTTVETTEPVLETTPAVMDSLVGGADAAPIVIIGSGYAGYGLAEAIRKRNADIPVVMFTEDDGANYTKPGLSNAMARGKQPADLASATAAEMAGKLGITVHAHTAVHTIDTENKTLHSGLGDLAYGKLVLATGAEPIDLQLAGDGAADVLSVNSLTDYRLFCERLTQAAGKRVAIIGNGLVGCEFANELAAQGYTVSVIGLTGWALNPLLPELMGKELEARLQQKGVAWYLGNTVSSVNKAGNSYQLSLREGQSLEVDLVLSAVGLRPRTGLARAAGLKCQRGIVVDECLQTSAADVYALGDCSEVHGQVLPYIAPITHGLRALVDTVLGAPAAVTYPLMPVVVKTPAMPLLLMPPQAGTQGEWQVEATEQGMRGLFVDTTQRVCGFALADARQQERQQWLDAINTEHHLRQ